MDATEATPIAAPGLERKIGLAWAALAWEGLWPRLMPLLAFVALFVAAAHLDLFAGLDPWVHTGLLGVLGNIIWFVLAGWWLALAHLVTAFVLALTIVGLPFAWAHLKLAGIALWPIGKTIVPA